MTVTTEHFHNGNNSTTTFAYTFPYYKTSDIKVKVGGTLKTESTHYNITGTNVVFTSGNVPPSGTGNVHIYRETDVDTSKATFAAGSSIRATDLNNNETQLLYHAQEQNFNKIQTADVEDGAITSAKILDGTIATADLADGAVNAAKIGTNAIDASNLAANSVGASELADDAVDTAAIADNAVTSAKIANGTILADDLANNSVTTDKIYNEAVTAAKIGPSAVTSAKIDSNAIVAAKIATDAVTETKILDSSITVNKIANDAVTIDKLADNSVDSQHYVDGSIDLAHMSANSVDSNQYVSGSIDLVHLSTGSVDSSKIVDESIVNADIANAAGIAHSKLSGMSAGNVLIGNSSNVANSTTISGDVTINSSGVTAITAGSIVTTDIAADAIDGTKIADNSINSEHYVDASIDHVHLANDVIDGDNIQDDVINSEHIAAGALDNEHYAAGSVTSDKLNAATVVTNSEQAAASANDTSFFTTSASDARYFNVSTGDTIKDGDAFPDNDTTIATTAAINDRIIDLVDDVGGFVPIANETSFPNANPDVNNGTGTLVSIKALASNLVSNGSGVATIANGTVGNSTVTITGLANSTTYLATYGMIVETTSTLNTYTFHRQVPIATEISTVAGSISNVNTVAGSISNVNAVAGNATNVNTVAGANSNISSVAGSISNVNSVASNIGTVNDFAARYRTGSNNPTSSLDTGDLFFNTSANELKVYNGSAWQGGVTASGNFASITGNTFTGDNLYNDGVKGKFGTGNDLEIYHDGNSRIQNTNNSCDFRIQSDAIELKANSVDEMMLKGVVNGAVELYYDNTKRIETTNYGVLISSRLNAQTIIIEDWDSGNETGAVKLGTGNDLKIFHDGSKSYLVNGTGNLELQNSSRSIDIKSDSFTVKNGADNEWMMTATANGAVELYYDNVKTFKTQPSGVKVFGPEGGSAFLYLYADEGDDNADKYWLKTEQDGTGFLIQNYVSGSTETNLRALGNGTVELYYDNSLKLQTQSWGVQFTGNLYGGDSEKIILGNGNDLEIYHNGTDSYIANKTGDLKILGKSGQVAIKIVPDAEVELRYNDSKKIETMSGGVRVQGQVAVEGSGVSLSIEDGGKAAFGNGDDLKIYHSGSHSYIDENGTGILAIRSNGTEIALTSVSGESMGRFINDAACEFYYDSTKRLETTSTGVWITGHCTLGADNDILRIGTHQDLQLYHSGTDTFINNTKGTLNIRSLGNDVSDNSIIITAEHHIFIKPNGGDNGITINDSGAVYLYYNDFKSFETYSHGITVYGPEGGNAVLNLYADEGDDNADKWHLLAGTDGNLLIRNLADGSGSDTSIKCVSDGAVELYYDNTKTFETVDNGIKIVAAENNHARIHMWADEGDDSADKWEIMATTQGHLKFYHGASSENTIVLNGDGAVDLYYDNSLKFSTKTDGVTINGDIGFVAAGNGIDFGANPHQSGMSSEKFDSYEEGTWTPDPWDGTCTISNARYIRVGNVCHIWALCHSFSDTTTNDQVGITGMPFTSVSNGAKGSAMYRYADDANKTVVYFSSTPRLHFYGGNTGGYTQLRHNEINSSNFEVYFHATYDVS